MEKKKKWIAWIIIIVMLSIGIEPSLSNTVFQAKTTTKEKVLEEKISNKQINITKTYYNKLEKEAQSVYQYFETEYVTKDIFQITGSAVTYNLPIKNNENYDNNYRIDSQTNIEQTDVYKRIKKSCDSAIIAFLNDYPKVYWIKNITYKIESEKFQAGIYINKVIFTPQQYYNNAIEELGDVENAITELKTKLRLLEEDEVYEKAKKIHDFLAQNVFHYKQTKEETDSLKAETIAGVLLDKKATSEGYAKAYKILCDEFEIPCFLVKGTINKNTNAMWNYVQIPFPNKENHIFWYAIDVYNDDTDKENIVNSYLFSGVNTKLDGESDTFSQKYKSNDTELIPSEQYAQAAFNENGIRIEAITLDRNTLPLNKKTMTGQLNIKTITPNNHTEKGKYAVTWKSEDEKVAVVAIKNGLVTAKDTGSTKVTATMTVSPENYTVQDSCTITADMGEEIISVSSVALNQTLLNLKVGDTTTLKAVVTPSNATNQQIKWSSSDNRVASVDQAGVVTAKDSGVATITVSTVDGGKTANCTVQVSESSETGSDTTITVILSNSYLNLSASNRTANLTATITPTNVSNQKVTWSSSNNAIATVTQEGLVTAIADGTTTITATSLEGSKTATCTVVVNMAGNFTSTTIVTVIPNSDTIQKGTYKQFSASVTGTTNPTQTVIWSIDSAHVTNTTINSYGLLYVAPEETATSLIIRAASTSDTTKYGIAMVTIGTISNPYAAPIIPSITQDLPTTKTAEVGSYVSLQVTANTTDGGVLTYQWYKDNIPISGAINSYYSIVNAKESEAGSYKVEIKNTKIGQVATKMSNICKLSIGNSNSVINNDSIPKIEGDTSKSGWDSIKSSIRSAPKKGSVSVLMDGASMVPRSILESLEDKDVTLNLDMGNGVVWSIKGTNVDDAKTINLKVTLDTDTVSSQVISDAIKSGEIKQFSLVQNGSLGVTATMKLAVGTDYNNKIASLFYYNKSKRKLELQSVGRVDSTGNVNLIFTHASDYVLVLDSVPILSESVKNCKATAAKKTLSASKKNDRTQKIKIKLTDAVKQAVNNKMARKKITYSSNKKSVAAVSSKGVITAKKKGTATIKVVIKIDSYEKVSKLKIKVKK